MKGLNGYKHAVSNPNMTQEGPDLEKVVLNRFVGLLKIHDECVQEKRTQALGPPSTNISVCTCFFIMLEVVQKIDSIIECLR